ncbi:GNAT family N-acetyltransferase [Enterococcus innesii]|uniref:GNAT family N-acetyltransferase n=1 Tax=Enterococcus innesii TaxID=2839759 RepID=UPI0022B96028|nr:GNAT family N-acetyltransferase [Enterococcus innesii]
MDYKLATFADLNKIVDFHLENFEGYYLTNLGKDVLNKYYYFFLNNKKNKFFLVKDGEEIVGLALFVEDFEEQINVFYKNNFLLLSKNILKKFVLLNKPVISGTLSRVISTVKSDSNIYDLPRMSLLSLAIDKKNRSQGIGKSLIDFSEVYLNDLGYQSYYLSVLNTNFRGINFYKRLGFKPIKTDNNLVYFEKSIMEGPIDDRQVNA